MNQHTTPPSPGRWTWAAIVPVRKGEWRAVLLSALYFFFVLESYYLLRPVREAMGIGGGADKLPWLMTGTLLAMTGVNPLFAWLVSRSPRRVFIPVTYRFFAVNMLLFFGLFSLFPKEWITGLGYAFYIWLSVFNLFVVSVFWSLMSDIYTREKSKRLFGIIAIGGTIGAIFGSTITGWFVSGIDLEKLGMGPYIFKVPVAGMLLIAIVPLELAVWCVKWLLKWQATRAAPMDLKCKGCQYDLAGLATPGLEVRCPECGRVQIFGEPAPREPSVGIFDGLTGIAKSPYMLLIALYMLLLAITSTFVYIEQGRIIEAAFPGDKAGQTSAFAQIDSWSNILTLITQVLLTGQALRIIGIGGALCLLPLLTIGGFAALWMYPTVAVLTWFQVTRRGMHYAMMRPAREMLFTVLGQNERYKSKTFIDTFVFRAGDMIGGWVPLWVKALSVAIGWLAVPVSILWLVIGGALGVLQARKAAAAETKRNRDAETK